MCYTYPKLYGPDVGIPGLRIRVEVSYNARVQGSAARAIRDERESDNEKLHDLGCRVEACSGRSNKSNGEINAKEAETEKEAGTLDGAM